MIEEVLLDQWYGQDEEFFKIIAEDGNLIYTAPRIIAPPAEKKRSRRDAKQSLEYRNHGSATNGGRRFRS